uniref:SNF2 N-terminal domain-containing protein n=1 Tax=Hyaloperonospora arabidopsidis (strain Emoy2) TaxID=559515 RepID=M4C633_HYAAE
MGTGKTMMSISLVSVLQQCEGFGRALVLSPPHLVYKWRREILETVPGARVTVLNGPDTLQKLLRLRSAGAPSASSPEFFVLGRVRMRMGFHWRPAYSTRRIRLGEKEADQVVATVVACTDCGAMQTDAEGVPLVVESTESDRRLSVSAVAGRFGV